MQKFLLGALFGGTLVWYTNDTFVAPINITITIGVNAEKKPETSS